MGPWMGLWMGLGSVPWKVLWSGRKFEPRTRMEPGKKLWIFVRVVMVPLSGHELIVNGESDVMKQLRPLRRI
jgi:hypothetical protein